MRERRAIDWREEAPAAGRGPVVLGYQAPRDRLGEVPPARGRWLAGLAAVMFGVSFFLPTVRYAPGWEAAIIATSVWLHPDEWLTGLFLLMVGAAANPLFLGATVWFFLATTRRGRALGRSVQPALWLASLAFMSSMTCLVGFAIIEEVGIWQTFFYVYGAGTHLWFAAPGVLAVAAIRARRRAPFQVRN